jgi:hypothetical protein
MSKLVERMSRSLLSRDSELYKRVYELLEEHTYTWVTDAWVKNPSTGAIKVQQLTHPSDKEMLECAAQHGLDTQGAFGARDARRGYVMLHVNQQKVLVTHDVADQLLHLLREHVDEA